VAVAATTAAVAAASATTVISPSAPEDDDESRSLAVSIADRLYTLVRSRADFAADLQRICRLQFALTNGESPRM